MYTLMNKYMIMAVDRPPSRVERNILQAWIDIQIWAKVVTHVISKTMRQEQSTGITLYALEHTKINQTATIP